MSAASLERSLDCAEELNDVIICAATNSGEILERYIIRPFEEVCISSRVPPIPPSLSTAFLVL